MYCMLLFSLNIHHIFYICYPPSLCHCYHASPNPSSCLGKTQYIATSRFYMLGRLPRLKKSCFWCQLQYDYPDVIWTLSLLYYEHCPKSFHILVHPRNSRVGNSYELFLGPLAALGSKVTPPLHLEIGQNVWLYIFQLYMEKYQQW